MKQLRKKATLYKSDPVFLMESQDSTSSSISKLVNEKIGRYQSLILNSQHGLSSADVSYLKKIYNPNNLTAGLVELIAVMKAKNSQELEALISRIEKMDLLSKYSLIEELEKI